MPGPSEMSELCRTLGPACTRASLRLLLWVTGPRVCTALRPSGRPPLHGVQSEQAASSSGASQSRASLPCTSLGCCVSPSVSRSHSLQLGRLLHCAVWQSPGPSRPSSHGSFYMKAPVPSASACRLQARQCPAQPGDQATPLRLSTRPQSTRIPGSGGFS